MIWKCIFNTLNPAFSHPNFQFVIVSVLPKKIKNNDAIFKNSLELVLYKEIQF